MADNAPYIKVKIDQLDTRKKALQEEIKQIDARKKAYNAQLADEAKTAAKPAPQSTPQD